MSEAFSFIIRDGLASDIDDCLDLDHTYETDYVWQMRIEGDGGRWSVAFTTERLPRTIDLDYPASRKRLELALAEEHGFLVAVGKNEPEMLGYVTIRNDPIYGIARIQDIVVSRPFRRKKLGSRLLKVARQWAQEQELLQLIAEIQTKNYPGIQFCLNRGFSFCGFNDQYFPNQDIAVFFGQSLRGIP